MPSDKSDYKEIIREWDNNAAARCAQLDSGEDISHDQVLLPAMLSLAGSLDGYDVLDAGCGCGFLARAIADRCHSVLGVDLSSKMIAEARSRSTGLPTVSFICASIEELATRPVAPFDVCFANMVLMTVPDLKSVCRSIWSSMKAAGRFIFSVPHPCFWNVYRKDESDESFDYWEEHRVIAPFRISLDQNPLPSPTSYFHRPLSSYWGVLESSGFRVVALEEPRAPRAAPPEYVDNFRVPRFLVMSALKI
jgi:SAM-dependent methyltransferase